MNDYLMHHGVMGMKWGVRRYQNADGSYTAEGRRHYGVGSEHSGDVQTSTSLSSEAPRARERSFDKEKAKKALKIGATAVGVALAVYGTHKLINNQAAIDAGKAFMDRAIHSEALGKAKESIKSSTEYKLAVKAGGAVKNAAKVLSNDKTAKTIAGIGAFASTAQLLRTQVKDLKEYVKDTKGDIRDIDRDLEIAKKASALGSTLSKISKFPPDAPTNAKADAPTNAKATSQNTQKNTDSNQQKATTKDYEKIYDSLDRMSAINPTAAVGHPAGFQNDDYYQRLFRGNPTEEEKMYARAMKEVGYSGQQIYAFIVEQEGVKKALEHSAFYAQLGRAYLASIM